MSGKLKNGIKIFSKPRSSQGIDQSNILHVLINYSRSTKLTEILMQFSKFLKQIEDVYKIYTLFKIMLMILRWD